MIVSNAVGPDDARRATDAVAEGPRLASRLWRGVEDFLIERLGGVALVTSALVAAVCALALAEGARPPAREEGITGSVRAQSRPAVSPAPEAWQNLRRPIEIVSLQATLTEKLPISYSAARRGDERRDLLSFGHFDDDRPDIGIALRRGGPPARETLLVDAARQQAERGVSVVRGSRPDRLDSKFGALDIGEMEFLHATGVRKACIAFRSSERAGGIGIEGWYCAAPGAPAERPALACLIDRLTLLRAGEDVALRQFFQDAERRRAACPPQAVSAARKPTWLDQDGRRPDIRGELVTGSLRRTRD
jgi:hypothetical protein